MTIPIGTAVQWMIDARSSHRMLPPLSETEELTLEHAYTIHDALRAEFERRGERPIGWKLGATSPSGQAIMGVKEPASGFLLPVQYANGGEIPVSAFTNLGVEAEVAFRMRTELTGPGVTLATAMTAVEGAMPALELLDFMFSGTPRAADFVANSIVANSIMLGGPITPLEEVNLTLEEVVYEHNGEIAGNYTTAEVMGNPLNALVWLANHLGTRGLALKPGDVVMSGGVTKMLRPQAGDTIRASFTRLGTVSVTVVP